MTTASLLSDPISYLWREARAWLAGMLADFISPACVARAFAREARVAFRRRLQMLESLVMKLLLIEASRLHKSEGTSMPAPKLSSEDRRLPAGKTATQRTQASACAEHPAHPITWRVRFHARIPRQRQAAAVARGPRIQRTPACAQTLALRLARRFEALRRVIADPRDAIAALARKLQALGAAAHAAARRIALWRPRFGAASVALGLAIVSAHDACQRWWSSS